jgi:iron complex outermembrane receptor protein
VKTEFLGTSNNGGTAIKTILLGNGVTGVDSAQFFTNAIDTRTRGVDVVAEYTLRTDSLGTFRTTAAYSLNRTKILSIKANPAALSSLNVVLFGRQAQYDLRFSTPRDKLVFGTEWNLDKVRVNARLSRYGRYLEAGTTEIGDRRFGARLVADLDVGVDVSKAITLAVGANNLFDAYPQKNGIVAADGSGQYGNFAPFGLSGGSYYGRVEVRF